MKRHGSSDSLIQICPSGSPEETGVYGRRGFPSIMDAMEDEECGEEELCSGGGSHHSGGGGGGGGEKKRRLSTEQVRALEKNFEVENKLDPERKVRLAQDLGLQPRQVAVWFQNRRARWKTKQLERDYTALKSSYDVLRLDFDALHRDNQSLAAEIKELKAKLSGETTTTVKEEELVASESEIKPEDEEPPTLIYKDGFSDSDSSAVLNEDSSTTSMLNNNSDKSKSAAFAWQPSFMSSESRVHKGGFGLGLGFSFQHQLMKAVEEHGFLAGEEPCSSFFSEEQAPTLPWCYEQWNWMDTGGENNNVGRKEGPF